MKLEAALQLNDNRNNINSKRVASTIFEESQRNDLDLGPFFVGGFVALLLGWMLIRYKMSYHRSSNYNGAVYCCPESCFKFCEKSVDSKTDK